MSMFAVSVSFQNGISTSESPNYLFSNPGVRCLVNRSDTNTALQDGPVVRFGSPVHFKPSISTLQLVASWHSWSLDDHVYDAIADLQVHDYVHAPVCFFVKETTSGTSACVCICVCVCNINQQPTTTFQMSKTYQARGPV